MISRKFFVCQIPTHQQGVFTVLVAILMVSLLAFSAFAIDISQIISNQRLLQSATDAAALAGGQSLWTGTWTQANSSAQLYAAGGSSSYNALPSNVTIKSTTITPLKLNSVTLPASQANSTYNGIRVSQTASVALTFGPILGVNSISITATSTASAGGGGAQALNVVIVLDTTKSMSNTTDANCGNVTKLQCALNGAQSLVNQLKTAGDYVGLVVFPPLASQASVTTDASCNSAGITTKSYMAGSGSYLWEDTTSMISTVVALTPSSSYMTNGQANTSNSLINAVGIGPTGTKCTGIAAPGGEGTYYAQAIYQAQANLTALSATNKQQNVMIILSDGDANASGSEINSSYATNECQQAIVAANAAKTASTWVYVIAYQAATSGGCSTDTSNLSHVNDKGVQPCTTLQWLAGKTASTTAPTSSTLSPLFYSDNTPTCLSNNAMANVSTLFAAVGSTLMSPRLIPNNAQ